MQRFIDRTFSSCPLLATCYNEKISGKEDERERGGEGGREGGRDIKDERLHLLHLILDIFHFKHVNLNKDRKFMKFTDLTNIVLHSKSKIEIHKLRKWFGCNASIAW
jgi:hypothetical protein